MVIKFNTIVNKLQIQNSTKIYVLLDNFLFTGDCRKGYLQKKYHFKNFIAPPYFERAKRLLANIPRSRCCKSLISLIKSKPQSQSQTLSSSYCSSDSSFSVCFDSLCTFKPSRKVTLVYFYTVNYYFLFQGSRIENCLNLECERPISTISGDNTKTTGSGRNEAGGRKELTHTRA